MYTKINISISDLYLDLNNPRMEATSQEEEINYLCNYEYVDILAQDIVKHGLNPLELLGVMKNDNESYIALEGNRRACALMLLSDPELAPSKLKKKFIKLKKEWVNAIDKIECVLFSKREDADIWLDRLHNGEQQGLGRKQWNAIQKQRRNRNPENKRAMLVLDYALEQGWINEADIRDKLTTATRYLVNENLLKIIGIDSDKDNLKHTKDLNIFNAMLKKFIGDLKKSSVGGDVSSRANKPEIDAYAEKLLQEYKTANGDNNNDHVHREPKPVYPETSSTPSLKERKPRVPKAPKTLSIELKYNKELDEQLKNLDNIKLRTLYLSLFKVDINDTNLVPLVTVGLWSFVDSLASELGRIGKTEFSSFFGNHKQHYENANSQKAITTAFSDLEKLGNCTKHHKDYANFNPEALVTVMNTISPFLAYCINKIKS